MQWKEKVQNTPWQSLSVRSSWFPRAKKPVVKRCGNGGKAVPRIHDQQLMGCLKILQLFQVSASCSWHIIGVPNTLVPRVDTEYLALTGLGHSCEDLPRSAGSYGMLQKTDPKCYIYIHKMLHFYKSASVQ